MISIYKFETKSTLILRNSSYLMRLAILRSHDKVFHCGLESTLSNLQLKYWVTKRRQAFKKVLKNFFLYLN